VLRLPPFSKCYGRLTSFAAMATVGVKGGTTMDIRKMVVSVLAVTVLGAAAAFAQTDTPADSPPSGAAGSSANAPASADGTSSASQGSSETSTTPDDSSGKSIDPVVRDPVTGTPSSDAKPANEAGNQAGPDIGSDSSSR
jgi:hypothetical protein